MNGRSRHSDYMNRNAKKLRKPRQYATKPSRTFLQKKKKAPEKHLETVTMWAEFLTQEAEFKTLLDPQEENAETLERALSAIEAHPLHTKKIAPRRKRGGKKRQAHAPARVHKVSFRLQTRHVPRIPPAD